MNEICLLPKKERILFFRAAAEIKKIPLEIIEKDYWVVWVLEKAFSIEKLSPHLTFKGGTSLSKVYGLIDRFSEDADLSIEKEFFGFQPLDGPENAKSKKKQQRFLDELLRTCSQYIQNEMHAELTEIISSKLGTIESWRLFIDPDDPDGQTLLFEYPSETQNDRYIRPLVKIELGARAEHWPVSQHKIQSYVKEALEEKIHEPEIWIRVLNVERTFWEKATILHQYAHLPLHKNLPARISRHYYDFFRLLNSNIKEKALADPSLLDRVAKHKNIYFASNWANYESAQKGSLKLSPPERILKELEKDYALMESMLFREIPSWDLILETIKKFEEEFNLKVIGTSLYI